MRNGGLLLLATVGSFGLLACSGTRLHVGDDGTGHAGSGGAAGGATASGGGGKAAGGTMGTGAGGAAEVTGTGGPAVATGAGGSAVTTGTGGAAGQAGGGAVLEPRLSVSPSSATFASTLVEAVSAPQTFTVRNEGSAAAGTATALAATFAGTNAADFLITSNGCAAALAPGASCELMVAFAPKTRSGSRSASLTVSAPLGAAAPVALTGTASPSLGHLAGGLGGIGSLDGTGAAAHFYNPSGVASDGAGNLYVADNSNHTIRKAVLATGAVTTLAGAAGQEGSADGTGAAARFLDPNGIASDGAGNLYVADAGNSTIRKIVIATGVVTTLAGLAATTGKTDASGAAARFYYPEGVASDGAGNLYVADTGNGTIRKIVIATRAVTTLAGLAGTSGLGHADGTGAEARFTQPGGILSDGAGNLYVTDGADGTIRKIVIATGAVTTFAGAAGQRTQGDGTGVDARFSGPNGIAGDGAGNLYVVDSAGQVIRKIVIATAEVTTLAGAAGQMGDTDDTGYLARFRNPSGIAGDGRGNLYVSDYANNTIRKIVTSTAEVTTFAGTASRPGSTDGTGRDARFYAPSGIASDGAGNVYVADTNNQIIRKVVVATGAVTTLAGNTGQPGPLDGTGTAAYFNFPSGVALDGAGNLYVADTNNHTIRKIVLATGAVTTLAGTAGSWNHVDGTGADANFFGVYALALDGAGNLYAAESVTIRKVVIATGAVTTLGNVPGRSPEDPGPSGIALDGAGNLYVADPWAAVWKMSIATGTVTSFAGTDETGAAATFKAPKGIAGDGAGNLYVADENTIRKIAIGAGKVSTIIGAAGRVGVALGALPASLNVPYGVVVLPTGELAIVDSQEGALLIGHL